MPKARTRALARRTRIPRVYYRAFKRRTHHKRRIPLLVIAGFLPIGGESINIARQNWTMAEKGKRLMQLWVNSVTGYDFIEKRWRWDVMMANTLPIFGGMIAHKYLGKYINKYIPKMIPFEL